MLEASRTEKSGELNRLRSQIERAPKVEAALQVLSDKMFAQIVHVVEEKLTIALQEVLEQPIKLRARADYKNNATTIDFYIERDGNEEDIMRGQGGSVANVLSVGLRMFALAALDARRHRRFLVLDEQDCWLRPELVPRLVKIVRDACEALDFQVIMISHHDVSLFEDFADRIYLFTPQADGSVSVQLASIAPKGEVNLSAAEF